MPDESFRYKLAFSMVKNISIDLAERILMRFESEKDFFTSTSTQLELINKIPKKIADGAYRDSLLTRAREEERFIIANEIEPLYYRDDNFSSRLVNCSDGPAMLYKLGDAEINARHIVSIVGTRHATPHGIEITNRIVRELSERLDDLVIISGLAYGIDIAAHKAALNCGVPTIAVMAHPLNTVYPAEHRGVAVRIIREGGALVTEYNTGDEVHRANFLARNRIIAGLADVSIVVESDIKGGSLVTAGLALEYNREVFAVPGRLTDKYSQGTLALISANKAHIFVSAEDLIAEMGWQSKTVEGDQMALALEMSPQEQQIYDFLMTHPGSPVNDIMIGTSIPTGQVKDLLFNMELHDRVISMAGGRYSAL